MHPTTLRLPGRPHLVVIALIAACLAVVGTVAPSGPADATVYEVTRTRHEQGPFGPLTIIGDSVLIGSVYWGPTLDDHLVNAGWGPIRLRAGVGDNARTAASTIQSWRAQGWDADALVINIGANDAAGCQGSESCAYAAIMRVVDAAGPGKRIWWPKTTDHPVNSRHLAWNRALDRVAAERPARFFTWDWPTVMYEIGEYIEADHIHQTAAGYRERSIRMEREITASLAMGEMSGDPVPLPSPSAAPSEMVPIEPIRALDTREEPPGRLAAGQIVEVDVSSYVPADATAVAAYVTAANPSAAGHLSAQPCGRAPTSSVTNYVTGVNRGAVTITPLSADKTFCVFSHAATHLVVDLQAAFVPDGLRFTPLAVPDRLEDTRATTATRHLEIAVPDGAEAVAVNLTAVHAAFAGHVTAHPCLDEIPNFANLNYLANEVVASAAYVPVSADGTICLDAYTPVDLVVDLTGVFAADGDLEFVPVVPTRTLDSRFGTGGWAPIHGHGQIIPARVAPAAARAVSGTMTLVRPVRDSHLQAWGCGERDESSNVNALAGGTLANFVTTGIDAGELCVFAINTGHTVFDTTGWWVP